MQVNKLAVLGIVLASIAVPTRGQTYTYYDAFNGTMVEPTKNSPWGSSKVLRSSISNALFMVC